LPDHYIKDLLADCGGQTTPANSCRNIRFYLKTKVVKASPFKPFLIPCLLLRPKEKWLTVDG
jgi:hypothetical protein